MDTFEETIKIASDRIYESARKYKPYPTVGELIEMLKGFPGDMPVFIDTEGEELIPAGEVEKCKILLETWKK